MTANIRHWVWGGSQIADLFVVVSDVGLVAIRLIDCP